jgi:hypothetical protein
MISGMAFHGFNMVAIVASFPFLKYLDISSSN